MWLTCLCLLRAQEGAEVDAAPLALGLVSF